MGGRTYTTHLIPAAFTKPATCGLFFARLFKSETCPAPPPGHYAKRTARRAARSRTVEPGPWTASPEPGAHEKNLLVRAARTANRAPRYPEHGLRSPETLPGPPNNRGYSRRSRRVRRRENRDFFKIITKRVPVQISHKQHGPKTNAFN